MSKPGSDTVADVMRTDVVTIDPGESLLEADRIMRLARIRHLPVVSDGVLRGVLSHRDVLEASLAKLDEPQGPERLDHLREITVGRILKGAALTCEPGTGVRDAALRMLRLKIGCLPVVEDTPEGPRLLGLVTESDLVRVAYVPEFEGASD